MNNFRRNQKKQSGKIKSYLLIGLIILIIYNFYKYNNFKTKIIIKSEKIISIKKGDSFKSINEKIPGINNIFLNIYLKFNTPNFELQTGRYKIESGSNINKIIESLKNPIPEEEIYITILEGWSIYDIDYCLSDPKGFFDKTENICVYKLTNDSKKELLDFSLIEKGEYIDYVTSKDKINEISQIDGANFGFLNGLSSLEGFLYPDTYSLNLSKFEVIKLVVDKQLSTFEEKVYNVLLKNLQKEDIYDLINLASIVEKEEKNPDEKPTVAGILKKRLNNGWLIGADITVCYPHKLTSYECNLLISKYINEKSDYNTRTMVGLPKTPIGNPSFDTVEATLNENNTDYWYYLHNIKTGKIYYGRTGK